MLHTRKVALCRYQYDPLDRIAGCSSAGADSVHRFYQKNRLTTEIQGQSRRALFKVDDQLLAQQVLENTSSSTALLATDQQRSVLHQTAGAQQTARAYTAYGFSPAHFNVPGFNGEQPDPVTGHYLLGNGYRAFNPVLMRFNSPDNLSPFGQGGLNAYAYCEGDPINLVDPEGHLSFPAAVSVLRAVLRFKKRPYAAWQALKMKYVTAPISNASETLPSLQTLSFSEVSGEMLNAMKNTKPYKNVIKKLNADVGQANLERFVVKGGSAKGSVAQKVEDALSGKGKGFLPEMARPYKQASSHPTNNRVFNDIDQSMLEIRGLDHLTQPRRHAAGRQYGPRDSDTSD